MSNMSSAAEIAAEIAAAAASVAATTTAATAPLPESEDDSGSDELIVEGGPVLPNRSPAQAPPPGSPTARVRLSAFANELDNSRPIAAPVTYSPPPVQYQSQSAQDTQAPMCVQPQTPIPYYIAAEQQPPPLAQPVAQPLQQPPPLAQSLTPAAAWTQTQATPLLQAMPLPYPIANTHSPAATGSRQPVAQGMMTTGQPQDQSQTTGQPPNQSQTLGQPPSQGQQRMQYPQSGPGPSSEPNSMTIYIRRPGTLVNIELNVTLMDTIGNVKKRSKRLRSHCASLGVTCAWRSGGTG